MNKVVKWFLRRRLNSEGKKGTAMGKLWVWLNGKKTLIGAIITLLGVILSNVVPLLPQFGVDAALVLKVTGVLTAVIGIAHKIYKFLFHEEHN